ncbi:sulfotransferase [Psychrosphaera ytuae]|uniref:Sulfotransferase n=1 Tax=Psychrosphaera ytuae TaxID=2820710 RepID=A0A975HI56_9GAMM|nr:sulfotransferase [Psychrosphaera ytuae]QTH63870.1 sulfotransferase [Psychrosphaera ytuae]
MSALSPIEQAKKAANCAHQHDRQGFKSTLSEMLKDQLALGVNWFPMAQFASVLGEINLAKQALDLLLSQSPQLGHFIQAAGMYAEWGDVNNAESILNKVPEAQRDNRWYHLNGVLLSQKGELQPAVEAFSVALQKAPLSMPTWMSLAKIQPLSEPQLAQLKAVNPEHFDLLTQAQFYTTLVEHHEGKGEKDLADSHLEQANQRMASMYANNGFSMSAQLSDNLKIKQVFSSLTSQSNSQYEHYAPVFIVGLPRSGTTLLARILTSHSDFDGGHEYALSRKALLPQEIHQDNLDKARFADQYLDLLAQRGLDTKLRIVDKTVDLHRYVGLLAEVFPKAKFIFIDRDEQDNKWSCYRNFFATGVPWSYKVEEINDYFDNFYQMTSHWKSLLGERGISISYEDLVREPQEVLESLFEALGVEFDDSVLSFYQRKDDLVNTVSFKQVRSPLNDNSINSARRNF